MNCSRTPARSGAQAVLGSSPEMMRIKTWMANAAAVEVPVLILGESGTGKEVLAREIHARSERTSGPFVKVSCPAIPGGLLESEMFGYEQGAFTGAVESRGGLLEAAEGGTLFLDEVGDLDYSLQAKLLHFLQDGAFMRIGGQLEKHADARIICATNRNLRAAVDAGKFRRDLFHRINVLTIQAPPLRRRRDDIPDLVDYFLRRSIEEFGTPERHISPRVLELLVQYDWPGNVRELENLIKRFAILGSEEAIVNDLLESTDYTEHTGTISLKSLTREAIRSMERKIILRVLYDNNWNRKKASEILKISYRTLFYKLKDVGIRKSNRLADTASETTSPASQHQETRQ